MQIVTDRGLDLSAEQLSRLENVHFVPLALTLAGKTYRSGEDIQPEEFYELLAATDEFPTTTQPPAGAFAALYERLAITDPDILSIHISSGLSGTLNAALEGAKLVPQANVTHFDTMTLSGAGGWIVEAAARTIKAGWPLPRILALLERIRAEAETLYTLDEMRYLIHGGRISHIKGLLASVLNIKPVIGVSHEDGRYAQRGQARTFKRAVARIVDLVAQQHAPGSALRVQVMHALNPEGADLLRAALDRVFDCTWLPVSPIAPVLGAHTGPSLVGVGFAPEAIFAEVPAADPTPQQIRSATPALMGV
ncbi:MAG: DegV family protein [Anaerolineae bacterium]|nr:DegV family protein [Anaerolineae bacterium]